MDLRKIRKFERIFKGVANHWRIEILLLVADHPGINVETITDELGGNFSTIAEHIQRLVNAGLIIKKYQGKTVTHTLSPYGQNILEFIKELK